MLDGYPTVSAPDERFAYNNGGYVVLALIAERASGVPLPRARAAARVRTGRAWSTPRSCARTSSRARRARLPRTADGSRTNVLHLPVRGTGDGGIYTTVADVSSLLGGALRRQDRLGGNRRGDGAPSQQRSRSREALRARLLARKSGDAVMLEGSDAGVSFWSAHDPGSGVTCSVISNSTDGAWPIARLLRERLSS